MLEKVPRLDLSDWLAAGVMECSACCGCDICRCHVTHFTIRSIRGQEEVMVLWAIFSSYNLYGSSAAVEHSPISIGHCGTVPPSKELWREEIPLLRCHKCLAGL